MATETSTIRVARATRDLLAEQARQRGVSLAAMLAEIAEEHLRQAIWRSEREASRSDTDSAEASSEIQEWDATLADGIG
jgi:predicted DNA-binding ribbon-helix-helix protein